MRRRKPHRRRLCKICGFRPVPLVCWSLVCSNCWPDYAREMHRVRQAHYRARKRLARTYRILAGEKDVPAA